MFELLSKAVVESKQKVNIPKLSKEEPEEKEECEKVNREEERGTELARVHALLRLCTQAAEKKGEYLNRCFSIPTIHSTDLQHVI